jgi:hypothetical protein
MLQNGEISRTYLGQKVITTRRQCFVSVALQRACCQGDNDDGALEQFPIAELILLVGLILGATFRLAAAVGFAVGSSRRLAVIVVRGL